MSLTRSELHEESGKPRRHRREIQLQLTAVTKRDGEWRSEGLMNARRLTVEGQLFLDDIDALPAEAQRQVTNVLASLKKRHL